MWFCVWFSMQLYPQWSKLSLVFNTWQFGLSNVFVHVFSDVSPAWWSNDRQSNRHELIQGSSVGQLVSQAKDEGMVDDPWHVKAGTCWDKGTQSTWKWWVGWKGYLQLQDAPKLTATLAGQVLLVASQLQRPTAWNSMTFLGKSGQNLHFQLIKRTEGTPAFV